VRDAIAESTFMMVYGSPLLQAAVGIDPADSRRPRHAGTSPMHQQLVSNRIAELKAKIPQGGLREGLVRTLLYVGMPRGGADGIDERGFKAIRRIRAAGLDGNTLPPELATLNLAEFKALVREQFFMLLIDRAAALASIPALLPKSAGARHTAFALLREVLGADGGIVGEAADRLRTAAAWFGIDPERALDEKIGALPMIGNVQLARAS
jgi:hypothetical protein